MIILAGLLACQKSPVEPSLPPGTEQPRPPDSPANEVYSTPSGYISTSQGLVPIPEGAIQIKILKVLPGRGSVLIFDSPTRSSTAGIEFGVTTSADLPDFFYWLIFRLVDESGNEVPTEWLQGGTNGPPPEGIRPNKTYHINYMVPVDKLRNVPAHVPTLRIKYPWGRSFGGFSGYLMNSNGSEIQTILNPSLNWHTPQ